VVPRRGNPAVIIAPTTIGYWIVCDRAVVPSRRGFPPSRIGGIMGHKIRQGILCALA
jgi:hypothetical protein